jgi:POT family proton-dependent oligopeptide transporter
MGFGERVAEIRGGFERSFWVANVSELFERLSYYAAFASLARYLHETLSFPTQRATDLSGLFGGSVWFLAIFGGAIADRLGFRRALSLAYLILSAAYFLLGSIGSPWLAPVRNSVPLILFVGFILMLPALGISLVKPCVVGTTARASNENVRSIGYSIYYTLVNIGGALGPFVASWVHRHMSVENVFRVSSLSVFLMFFVVLLLFREPKKSGEARTESIAVTIRNFCVVLGNYKLVLSITFLALALRIMMMIFSVFVVPLWVWVGLLLVIFLGASQFLRFLLLFSGYWIVYWQQFITLPIYVHDYVDPTADTERMLSIDAIVVIAFTVAFSVMTRKMSAFRAVVLGTLVSMLAFGVLGLSSSIWAAYGALVVLAVGELIQQPRYYDYISRLAPAGQQGTYMGFAFLPLGIGSFLGGPIGGALLHYFGEVRHRPQLFPWALVGIGMVTTALLWVYDRVVKPGSEESSQPTVDG